MAPSVDCAFGGAFFAAGVAFAAGVTFAAVFVAGGVAGELFAGPAKLLLTEMTEDVTPVTLKP